MGISILMVFFIINQPFGDIPVYGNPHIRYNMIYIIRIPGLELFELGVADG